MSINGDDNGAVLSIEGDGVQRHIRLVWLNLLELHEDFYFLVGHQEDEHVIVALEVNCLSGLVAHHLEITQFEALVGDDSDENE